MSKCKNSKERYYTGKENTPLGRGFCAHGEAVDKRMKGKDGYMYKVRKTKRGKRWKKVRKNTCSWTCCNPCRCNPCRCMTKKK